MAVNLITKSNLSVHEVEICGRVRQVREAARLSQMAFARSVGVTRVKISNCEYALAPLRFELAESICAQLDINLQWLATGQGPRHPRVVISPELSNQIPKRMLLSKAYSDVLRSHIEAYWREVEVKYPDFVDRSRKRWIWPLESFPSSLRLIQAELTTAKNFIREAEVSPSESRRRELLDEASINVITAMQQVESLERSLKPEVREWFDSKKRNAEARDGGKNKEQVTLDIPAALPEHAPMPADKSPLAALLARVRRAVSARGAKAELARKMKVKRQAVDQWLRLENPTAPTADAALRLAEMFPERNSQGAPKQSLANVTSIREAKTRKESKHEIKSSPPKR